MILYWHVGKLLPASILIFTPEFYPDRNRSGNQRIFFAEIPCNHRNTRVAICPSLTKPDYVRIVTTQMALAIVEPYAEGPDPREREGLEAIEILSNSLRPYLKADLAELVAE